MTILKFDAADIAAQIAHAQSATSYLPNWNGPITTPELILVVGHGVRLISNSAGQGPRISAQSPASKSVAYAEGFDPTVDQNWIATQRGAFGSLSGQFYTRILKDVQMLLDRGCHAIRLATDGHSIRVFVSEPSDYLIGGTYQVPSGLGGRFRVTLMDVRDTDALVKTDGNCEDFDNMPPFRVPLDNVFEETLQRAA